MGKKRKLFFNMIFSKYDKKNCALSLPKSIGFMGNFYPGMKVNTIDLSPNYAGSLMALTNGLGAITGIAAPTFVGFMIPNVRN